MLLSFPIALPTANAQEDTVIMGGMPTHSSAGVTGALPSGVTPDYTVNTRAFLSFAPNPIGVGQTLLVNVWTNPPISPNRFQQGYSVEIMKPDNTTFTVGPFNSYAADATAYFTFIPDVIGTWQLKFTFAGQYFPNGTWLNSNLVPVNTTNSYYLQSAYYEPASTDWQPLTVQESMVQSWPLNDLPTDYWTRPVHFENRAWWPILGAYPPYGVVGGGPTWPADTNIYMSNYNFVPYVEAPNTAHIVYKQQVGLAGMIGGTAGQYGQTSSASAPVIYAGRCYQTLTVPVNGVPTSCAVCWDIRTGQQYYAIPVSAGGVTPQVISYTPPGVGAVEGAIAESTYSVSLLNLASNRLIKIDPYSGAVTLNVTGMTPQLLGGAQGSVSQTGFYADPYVISIQTLGSGANTQYRLINWTTAGTSTNFTSRIANNVSLPWGFVNWGGGVLGYSGIVADFESNIMVWMVGMAPLALGVYHGTWMMAVDMTSGQLLWNRTYEDTRYSTACLVADHGMVAVLMEDGYYSAFDLHTGDRVWDSDPFSYPWSSAGFGAYAVQSAYGLLYRQAYDGVYAFNWSTGEMVWRFIAPAPPFETPYNDGNGTAVYSFNGGGFVADGKLYTYNTEHTPSYPRTRGWKLFCIDAMTGEGIWNITGAMSPGAVADGYLVNVNPDDGYVYSFGKGQSGTTVTASPKSSLQGTQVIIEGTVLDQSPAQPGTPCVSADSMTTQMEYLHMQLPQSGIWGNATMTGVPVKLTAIDPNCNIIDIGETTTDAYYGTFSYPWTPDMEGQYTIIASFDGDDSYGSSSASTGIVVGTTSATSTPTTSGTGDSSTNTTIMTVTIGMGIAVIIAIAIATVLILRKRA
ncbi:MAG: PQQ-binding-like beta-propeller repeat protein [Candidatus Bathyarchaeia archaeon]